jgi:hypothetical protein
MVQAVFRNAEFGDGHAMFPNLRAADMREMQAVSGNASGTILESGIKECHECFCMVVDGEVIAMYGYMDTGNDSAYVWLMGTDKIVDVKWQFLRAAKNWVKKMSNEFALLWSSADSRNTVHQDWYEWLGFTVVGKSKAGAGDVIFNRIEYKKEVRDV